MSKAKSIVLSVSILVISLMTTSCAQIPAVFNRAESGIDVLIQFACDANQFGFSEQEILTKLALDLQEEFSPDVNINVSESPVNIVENYKKAAESLRQEYGVDAAVQLIQERKEQLVGEGTLDEETRDDEILNEAMEDYNSALLQFEQELASSVNLADITPGNIGLVITQADGYGGKTISGEMWSIIYVGFVDIDFPLPTDIQQGTAGVFDYSNEFFSVYKDSYDDQARKNYILQYLANAAKKEIGHQFGLVDKPGDLGDAMRSDIDRTRAEHLERDAEPVHFSASDYATLIDELKNWAGGS